MTIDITFHYPPELMNLLIDTIPLLNRAKKDVFLFFQGAGLSGALMTQSHDRWRRDANSISKYEIVRQVLAELNARGEPCLRERREVLKRVVEFENYSSCWPADQLKAKGLVAEIRSVVNVKDSFTRMANERDTERQQRMVSIEAAHRSVRQKDSQIARLKDELFGLFSETNRQKRGKALEGVLNRLFETYGILIREAFALKGDDGEGIIEQIDGVIELDGHLYFVEMKWWDTPLGVPEISQHMMRVMFRAESRAIILSASDFTTPAVSTCKKALQQKVVVLCTLKEVVMLLERRGNLVEFIKRKVHAAQIDEAPFVEVTS